MFIARIEPTGGADGRWHRQSAAKRCFDAVCAALLLIALLPLLAGICIAIRLEGRGPLLFRQPRLGRGGRPFRLYKFRKFHARIERQGPALTLTDDLRMTRVGRFLQRTKFDELPQLWNVLRGEMSMVGPRPESLPFADCFAGELARVLCFTPGLFGPTQVLFRNESMLFPADDNPERFYREVLFAAKAQVDLAYYPRATLARDLLWMLRGILVVLFPQLSRSDRDELLQQVDAWVRAERRRRTRAPAALLRRPGRTAAD